MDLPEVDNIKARIGHYRELIKVHEKRLKVLELQAAVMGINTPLETVIEIEDIRTEI